jgi:hypothetical protein
MRPEYEIGTSLPLQMNGDHILPFPPRGQGGLYPAFGPAFLGASHHGSGPCYLCIYVYGLQREGGHSADLEAFTLVLFLLMGRKGQRCICLM